MTMRAASDRQAGFTLLEIMVVILIVGIMVTFASLSIGNRALEDTLETEAKRTLAIIELAEDEAEAKGVDIGLRFTTDGYQLLTVNNKKKWADYESSGPLRPRVLHEAVSMEVRVEGREISLPDSEQIAAEEADSSKREGESGKGSSKRKKASEPQVLLLSSGEATPFVISLSAPGLKLHYEVSGDELGHITLKRVTDKSA